MNRVKGIAIGLAILALAGFGVVQVLDAVAPAAGPETGYVIDDIPGLAKVGQYRLVLVDCPEAPTSWEDVINSCSNPRIIEVDGPTWQEYGVGDHYPAD